METAVAVGTSSLISGGPSGINEASSGINGSPSGNQGVTLGNHGGPTGITPPSLPPPMTHLELSAYCALFSSISSPASISGAPMAERRVSAAAFEKAGTSETDLDAIWALCVRARRAVNRRGLTGGGKGVGQGGATGLVTGLSKGGGGGGCGDSGLARRRRRRAAAAAGNASNQNGHDYNDSNTSSDPFSPPESPLESPPASPWDAEVTSYYGCISMLRYWSSLRYSSLRTLFLLAADLRRQPTPAHPSQFLLFCWCACPCAGFLSFPALFPCRVSLSQSTGLRKVSTYRLTRNALKPKRTQLERFKHF